MFLRRRGRPMSQDEALAYGIHLVAIPAHRAPAPAKDIAAFCTVFAAPGVFTDLRAPKLPLFREGHLVGGPLVNGMADECHGL